MIEERHDRSDHDGDGPCSRCNPECACCKAELEAVTDRGYWTVVLTTPEGVACKRETFCLSCVSRLARLGVNTLPEDN